MTVQNQVGLTDSKAKPTGQLTDANPSRTLEGGSLFPHEPELRDLRAAGFAEIRERIARAVPGTITDVSTIWGTPKFTGIAERAAFRPDKGEFRGTVTDGNDRMPYVGFWLSAPGLNSTFLLTEPDIEVDPTLVKWFTDAGIGGHHVAIADVKEMAAFLSASTHRVYSCDNYGPSMAEHSVNSAADFDLVSKKSWAARLAGSYAPYEEIIDMFDTPLSQELFDRVRGDGTRIFVKLCNDEHGGMGVKPAGNLAELTSIVASHQEHTAAAGLSHQLVLQRGIDGQSRSFCFFLDPSSTEIPIIAVTDQVVDPKTGRDLGNRHYPITDEVVRPLTGMIKTLRENILAVCPKAFGFVMCDFIQTDNGDGVAVYAIDPGLRPSASTPSAMAQLWVANSTGSYPYVRNNTLFQFPTGTTWADFTAIAGELADPSTILTSGRGIVPFSWEPKYGTGRAITIAPNEADHSELLSQLRAKFGDALLD